LRCAARFVLFQHSTPPKQDFFMTIDIAPHLRDIPDFPKPGIVFKDITPLLANGPVFRQVIKDIAAIYSDKGIEAFVGIESRGFIFGAPLAAELGIGFIPVRKPGKLPAETIKEEYELEYGTDTLEIHSDSFANLKKVVIIDDVLATGGTLAATAKLVEAAGGDVASLFCLLELGFLNGREKLSHDFETLLTL
jgi:adenine phosphoribosyltransferase